jgi:hypothetical protein
MIYHLQFGIRWDMGHALTGCVRHAVEPGGFSVRDHILPAHVWVPQRSKGHGPFTEAVPIRG